MTPPTSHFSNQLHPFCCRFCDANKKESFTSSSEKLTGVISRKAASMEKVMETGEQLGPFSDVQKKTFGVFRFEETWRVSVGSWGDLGWGICPTHWIPSMPSPFRSNIFHQGFVFGVSESLRGLTQNSAEFRRNSIYFSCISAAHFQALFPHL